MKKLKKNDFKKLALLGIAGGTALATQVNATETSEIIPSQLLAFGGCGGQNGCHSGTSGSGGGYQAYRNPSSNYYYNQMPQSSCNSASQVQYQPQPLQYEQLPQNYQQSSCSSAPQPQYNPGYNQSSQAPSGCAAMSHPQHYNQNMQAPSMQAPSGCASMSQPQYHQSPENMPNMSQPAPQVSYGCGAMRPQMTRQMMAGCNSPRPTNGQMPNQPETPAPVETPNDGVNKGQAYTQWETADNYRPSQAQNSSSMSPSSSSSSNSTYDSTSKSSTSKQKLSESDLTSQLNAQGKATYQGLDATGKALALKLANQDCKGRNECKGLNSCKTSEHTCAGKGSCAGTSEAPFKDKNLAVKVAGMKMAEKRAISK